MRGAESNAEKHAQGEAESPVERVESVMARILAIKDRLHLLTVESKDTAFKSGEDFEASFLALIEALDQAQLELNNIENVLSRKVANF